MRSDETTSEPIAPPTPNAPSTNAKPPAPLPVWSRTANGSSTSNTPIRTSTYRLAKASVANSHPVRKR
jgi:hypothetical protein